VKALLTKGSPSDGLIHAAEISVHKRYRKFARKATLFDSLQIGANDLDNVVCGLFRGLGVAWHVIADVVLHKLTHEAVDGPASGGEALENLSAILIVVQGAEDALELSDDFLGAVDEVQFFA
jgi:hypothetical protein